MIGIEAMSQSQLKGSEKGEFLVGVEGLNQSAELSKQAKESDKDCKGKIRCQSEEIKAEIVSHSEPSKQSQGAVKGTEKGLGKPTKRKRSSVDSNVLSTDKGSLVTECRQELDCLLEYYKELSHQALNLENGWCSSNNSLIACILEEKNFSFSKLVEVIYEKLKEKEGVTLAYVRSAVLSVGQRVMYGIPNADADVLEDESESCLWCWETRDMKLLPVNQRGDLNARRLGRKKIHERISALSAMLSALAISEHQENYKSNLTKASMKLGKALSLVEIRSLVETKKQRYDASMAEKTAKRKKNESLLEAQKEKSHNEKETKQRQEEAEKEEKRRAKEEAELKKLLKKQQEEAEKEEKRRVKEEAELKKQLKKQQEEAEKEEKRRVKEEAESKKQLKKQQEEAERDLRRRERVESEMKEQRSLKKQATIMERFLKTKRCNDSSDSVEKRLFTENPTCDLPCTASVTNATTSLMDNAFSRQDSLLSEDLRKLHINGWHKLARHNRSNRWGIRHKPKTELVKELKIHELSADIVPSEKVRPPNMEVASFKEFGIETNSNKLLDESEKSSVIDTIDILSPSPRLLRKKLLQFDKSNRPAYYGTWSKKSCSVGARHPFRQDPDLDYDVDSDEEWEEEEPGESLSDCEKDTEEECLDVENPKDEDESEDEFFVPDGYLSENEGAQVDSRSDQIEDEARSSITCQTELESEEIRVLRQQQKYLQSMTEQALRKGHPLVISNLMHEKSQIKMVEDINATCKIELMCLQALCMQTCSGALIIDISLEDTPEKEVQEVSQSQNKSSNTPTPTTAPISDSDLPEFVSSIRSNSQGINKVLEALHEKFPSIPKTQLRNKVKEISVYVDNRWQVKKEILERFGLSTSPEKMKRKGIASFFSKRCLPPKRNSIGASESSPQQCPKTKVLNNEAQPVHID